MTEIILASASPRRKELLEKAGFRFRVAVSDTEEKTDKKEPPAMVQDLALKKALAVEKMLPPARNRLILGADTIVVLDGEVLGKPADPADAVRMLSRLSGRTHQVYTGVAMVCGRSGDRTVRTFAECTDVTLYEMTEKEILSYVETGEPLDKAGAYGIQGRFFIHVKEIRGDYSNVVGLPAARVYHEMKSPEIREEGEEQV